MPSRWIEHVKEFAKKNKMSYGCALSDPNLKKGYVPTGDKKRKPEKLEMATPSTEPKPKNIAIKPRPEPAVAQKRKEREDDYKRKADLKRFRELEVEPKIDANYKKTIEKLKKAETLDEAQKIHKSYVRQINTILNKFNRDHDAFSLGERLDINDYEDIERPILDKKTTWISRKGPKTPDFAMGN
jgi:hypothetical protein